LRAKRVIAVGAAIFAESLRRQGVDVVEVEWAPPQEIERDLKDILDKIL
jgi:hypothetical protein